MKKFERLTQSRAETGKTSNEEQKKQTTTKTVKTNTVDMQWKGRKRKE